LPIQQLAFNLHKQCNKNLLATVGGVQATIYDNEHCGTHLDIVMNFVNRDTPSLPSVGKKDYENTSNPKRLLQCCCWVNSPEDDDDTWLAVGGIDRLIQIISIAHSRVLYILEGHSDTVEELACSPTTTTHLLSASKDGTVRLWDTSTRLCLQIFKTRATSLSFFNEGKQILTGGKNGCVKLWAIDDELNIIWSKKRKIPGGEPPPREPKTTEQCTTLILPYKTDIDCIKVLGEKIISKSTDGKICIWHPNLTEKIQQVDSEIKVKGCTNGRSHFDLSEDGKFICVGNSRGDVYIFNLLTGTKINSLEHKRSKSPVRGCVFAHHCKNVIFVSESMIWRWDFVVLDEEHKHKKDRKKAKMKEEKLKRQKTEENHTLGDEDIESNKE